MHLSDFTAIAEVSRESGGGFTAFRTADRVLDLGWPDDVAEQWLYDHLRATTTTQNQSGC